MKGPSVLSLVLPKGSLEAQVLELFSGADLAVIRGGDRDYAARIDDPRIDRVRFLRPQEIPQYVEQGLFDLGICGRDWVHETSSDVVSVTELEYSKATSNPVRIVLAVPKEMGVERGDQLPDGVRVSTEYPELTRRYFDEVGVKARIVPSYGATEAKVPDIVDAIVDVTETGSSLRKHGLKVIETLLTSRTELVANPAAYADQEKRTAMQDIALLLQGAIRARGQVLLKLNVAGADLAGLLDVLPSMTSPTVTDLAKSDHKAVETVVPKRGVNTLLPRLKSAGATDILELPISKIVE
jgi:ATP phosphoribosyltransferase